MEEPEGQSDMAPHRQADHRSPNIPPGHLGKCEHSPDLQLRWAPSASTQLIFSQVMLSSLITQTPEYGGHMFQEQGHSEPVHIPRHTTDGSLLISENHSYEINSMTGYLYKTPKPQAQTPVVRNYLGTSDWFMYQ